MPNIRVKKSRRRHLPFKKGVFLIAAVLVLGTLASFALDRAKLIDLPFFGSKSDSTTTDTSEDTIDYGPPTEEEKSETEQFKDKQNPAAPAEPSADKKSVTPIVASWGQNSQSKEVEVSGYVPGLVEEGGSCTLTLKKDSQVVTASKVATPDAKTVSCGFIAIDGDKLSSGSWSATLTYSSSSANGTSQAVEVKVE